MRLPKLAPVGTVARHLLAGVFVPALLLLAACGAEAPDGAKPTTTLTLDGKAPPIDPEVVRQDVEQHEAFGEVRKAACPRRIPDRSEARSPFPAINILEGLEYVTITDDTSRGMYEKVIELTDEGARELGDDLEEEEERYVITVARREYVPVVVRYENAPNRDDRVVVSFQWKWKPVNELGERLTLWAPHSDRDEHQGRATYQRTDDGWELDDVWFQENARDYVRGVYR